MKTGFWFELKLLADVFTRDGFRRLLGALTVVAGAALVVVAAVSALYGRSAPCAVAFERHGPRDKLHFRLKSVDELAREPKNSACATRVR